MSAASQDSQDHGHHKFTYWYMRMKGGSDGEDFAERMWQQNLIGILWGTWKIEHVLDDETGEIDPDKLNVSEIEKVCPQPDELNFNEKSLHAPRKFLLARIPGEHMIPEDRVVVAFDKSLHIGEVGELCKSTPDLVRNMFDENFKCRFVHESKSFSLAKLPASFRLISGTGQGTLQRIKAYAALVQLLDCHNSEEEIQKTLKDMTPEEFLPMLSDKQWEVVCAEYLREEANFRSLLLGIGGSLKDIDLCGVNGEGTRLLAQCKNSSRPWKPEKVAEWADSIAADPADILYFFNRGGFEETSEDEQRCYLISGEEIACWLEKVPDYLRQLKTL